MRNYLILIALLLLFACNENQSKEVGEDKSEDTLVTETNTKFDQFVLYGEIEDVGDSDTVKIMKTTKSGEFLEIGTASIDESGKFYVKVDKSENPYYQVYVNDEVSNLVYCDSDSIGFYYSQTKFSVVGSHETKVLWDIIDFNNKFKTKFDSLDLVRMSSKDISEISKKVEYLRKDGLDNFKSLLLSSSPSKVALDYAQDLVSSGSESGDYLVQLLEKNEINKDYRVYELIKSYLNLAIGGTATNFEAIDIDGKKITLDQYKGKYVLLDFWATWCRPCMAEIPNVKKAYEKYKLDGFEIIGISQDRNPEQWKQGIYNHKMSWVHLLDQGNVSQMYQINSIPSTFLLDKKGVIIAKNLRGNQLDDKLKEIFKH